MSNYVTIHYKKGQRVSVRFDPEEYIVTEVRTEGVWVTTPHEIKVAEQGKHEPISILCLIDRETGELYFDPTKS
jgi:hypothetical protein